MRRTSIDYCARPRAHYPGPIAGLSPSRDFKVELGTFFDLGEGKL